MTGKTKVFYLGFHKTGTTSFGALMKSLGLKSQSYYRPYSRSFAKALQDRDFGELFAIADSADAFDDDPWYLFYKDFEQRYPEAKFVFYERDPEKWYQSALLFFGRSTTPMAEFIFGEGKGSPLFNKEHQISIYKKHSADVRSYFQDRPQKFLEIYDLSDESAEAVARFLGYAVPAVAFPRENVSKLKGLERLKRRIKAQLAKVLGLKPRYMAED